MASGVLQIDEGTFVSAQRVRDKDGDVSTKLTYRDADGKTVVSTRPDFVADLTSQMRPGDKFSMYNAPPDGMKLHNESRNEISHSDGHGHSETQRFDRSGTVSATHRQHGNEIDLDNGERVQLHGPGADNVVKGIRKDDDIVVYNDGKGHPVIYNETQKTVSRQDAHGNYATARQPDEKMQGELTKITRDPKDPNKATLEITDDFGFQNTVTINDRPGRIEKLMKLGDAIEINRSETAPGRGDLQIKDATRSVSYERDHNGTESMVTHGRAGMQPVPGVTHQHGNGPVLGTAPGVPFNGTIQSVSNDHGVVKIAYNDALGKPHSIAIDGNHGANGQPGAGSLAAASSQTLHPGENFSLKFNNNGTYELAAYDQQTHTKTVATPGKGNEFHSEQSHIPKDGQERANASPSR